MVDFSASNRAGKSVAAVEIKGELRDGDDVVEETSATLDYVPQNFERFGALIFRGDPEACDLRLLPVGMLSRDRAQAAPPPRRAYGSGGFGAVFPPRLTLRFSIPTSAPPMPKAMAK